MSTGCMAMGVLLSAAPASSTLGKTFDSCPIVGRVTFRACIVSHSFHAEHFLRCHCVWHDSQLGLFEVSDGTETDAFLAQVLLLPGHKPEQEVRPVLARWELPCEIGSSCRRAAGEHLADQAQVAAPLALTDGWC